MNDIFYSYIELSVETLTGHKFEILVGLYETVLDVKTRIQRLEEIPASSQHLIWGSKEMKDDDVLADYDIYNGATLRLVTKMRGGPLKIKRTSMLDYQDINNYMEEDADTDDQMQYIIYGDLDNRMEFYVLANKGISSPLSRSHSRFSTSSSSCKLPSIGEEEKRKENEMTKIKMGMLQKRIKQHNQNIRESHLEENFKNNVSNKNLKTKIVISDGLIKINNNSNLHQNTLPLKHNDKIIKSQNILDKNLINEDILNTCYDDLAQTDCDKSIQFNDKSSAHQESDCKNIINNDICINNISSDISVHENLINQNLKNDSPRDLKKLYEKHKFRAINAINNDIDQLKSSKLPLKNSYSLYNTKSLPIYIPTKSSRNNIKHTYLFNKNGFKEEDSEKFKKDPLKFNLNCSKEPSNLIKTTLSNKELCDELNEDTETKDFKLNRTIKNKEIQNFLNCTYRQNSKTKNIDDYDVNCQNDSSHNNVQNKYNKPNKLYSESGVLVGSSSSHLRKDFSIKSPIIQSRHLLNNLVNVVDSPKLLEPIKSEYQIQKIPNNIVAKRNELIEHIDAIDNINNTLKKNNSAFINSGKLNINEYKYSNPNLCLPKIASYSQSLIANNNNDKIINKNYQLSKNNMDKKDIDGQWYNKHNENKKNSIDNHLPCLSENLQDFNADSDNCCAKENSEITHKLESTISFEEWRYGLEPKRGYIHIVPISKPFNENDTIYESNKETMTSSKCEQASDRCHCLTNYSYIDGASSSTYELTEKNIENINCANYLEDTKAKCISSIMDFNTALGKVNKYISSSHLNEIKLNDLSGDKLKAINKTCDIVIEKNVSKRMLSRCCYCRKRLKLAMEFPCRCGNIYCMIHKCPEDHMCSFDFQDEGKKIIRKNNPIVVARKLPDI